MGLRRKSRELALQTLFSIEFNKNLDSENIDDDFIKKFNEIVENSDIKLNDAIEKFALDLIRTTIANKNFIDEEIQKYLRNWSLENVGNLDKSILRMAIAEMFYIKTPYQVVINEALEITKRYSSEGSVKFVNGILDAVKNELPDEKN